MRNSSTLATFFGALLAAGALGAACANQNRKATDSVAAAEIGPQLGESHAGLPSNPSVPPPDAAYTPPPPLEYAQPLTRIPGQPLPGQMPPPVVIVEPGGENAPAEAPVYAPEGPITTVPAPSASSGGTAPTTPGATTPGTTTPGTTTPGTTTPGTATPNPTAPVAPAPAPGTNPAPAAPGAPAPTPAPAPTIPPAPTQAPAPTAPPAPSQMPAPVPQSASYEADPMQVRFDAGIRPGPIQPTPAPPAPPPPASPTPRTDGGIGNVGPAPVDGGGIGNAPRPDAGAIGGILFDGGIR